MMRFRYLLYALIATTLIYSTQWAWVIHVNGFTTLDLSPADLASISTTTGDQQSYIALAATGQTNPPFQYRVGAVVLPRLLMTLDWTPDTAFILSNAIQALCASLLIAHLLERFFKATVLECSVAIFALLTTVGVVRTGLFPMIDIATLLASVMVLYAILDGRLWVFVPIAIIAVTVKEVFAISGLFWAMFHYQSFSRRALALCFPVLTFMLIRVLFGASALEVNYGFDLSQGELPQYGLRFLSTSGVMLVLSETIRSVGILWLGAVANHRFIRIGLLTYVIPITLSAWVLSSRIARPLVVIAPLLIIGFILVLRRMTKPSP